MKQQVIGYDYFLNDSESSVQYTRILWNNQPPTIQKTLHRTDIENGLIFTVIVANDTVLPLTARQIGSWRANAES